MEKFKLKYFLNTDTLAIDFGHDYSERKDGDCFVRAIEGDSDLSGKYTHEMNIDEARLFVAKSTESLGKDIKRCLGLSIENDNNRKVLFKELVHFDE